MEVAMTKQHLGGGLSVSARSVLFLLIETIAMETHICSSSSISIEYTYMHTLVSCGPGPDGGELHNSLICLGPLKECSKTSPIPSGCHIHWDAQRQRHTICCRHHGQTPFLSVLNCNSAIHFFCHPHWAIPTSTDWGWSRSTSNKLFG